MDTLATQRCLPCEGGVPKLTREEAEHNLAMITGWTLADDVSEINKVFKFKDFKTALDFTNEIGRIAESEGHHPDIALSWGKVEVRLSTHAVNGLSVNDFILAAKIDTIPTSAKSVL